MRYYIPLILLTLTFAYTSNVFAGARPCSDDTFCLNHEINCGMIEVCENTSTFPTSDCSWCGTYCAESCPPPKQVTFEECMFVGTDNAYECFCSGNGKNFFKIECTQERFDFCVYDALGEVKRLLVVGDTTGDEYSLDLECSNLAFCGNMTKELDEECDSGMSGASVDCGGTEFCNVKNSCVCEEDTCGNGIVGNNEECDDGNSTDGDGCDSNCTYTACGNGIVTAGEECESNMDCMGPVGSESPDAIFYECISCMCVED